jgi:uncharacterized protein (DUF362 family)
MSEKLTAKQISNLQKLGGVNPADESYSRRDFAKRVGATGAVITGAVATGVAITDPWGMEGVKPPPPVKLGNYSVRDSLPASAPTVVVVRNNPEVQPAGETGESQAQRMIEAALKAMGGIDKFIKRGDIVVVKPNVAFDKNPDLAATSQPDSVAAVIKMCLAAGAREVRVCDNPINNPESCFFKTKVGDAALRAGAKLILPQESYFEQLYIGGETITNTWSMFYKPFKDATKVIGISPVKDHNLCRATVTMKNWYGLLGNPRNQFHQNIHGIIADFGLMMKPTLVIADGRKLLMRNGPTGGSLNDVKRGDAIVVGTDQVAVDSWCVSKLLEKQRHEIAYLDKSIAKGYGADWRPQWTTEVTV